MTTERASLIQSLAREEIGFISLERAELLTETNTGRRDFIGQKWDAAAGDWTRRVDAAMFDAAESAEFQRVRTEFRAIMARAGK